MRIRVTVLVWKDFLPLFKELDTPYFDFEDMTNLDKIIADSSSHKYQPLDSNAAKLAEFIQKVLN